MMIGTTRQVAAKAFVALMLVVAGLATAAATPVGAQTANPSGSWTRLADHVHARHENSFVELNGRLYLIGGRGVKPVEIYDPTTNTWSTGAPTPIEMHHFQAVVHDDLIYVIGAMTGGFPNEVPIDRVYIYDPHGDRWIEGPAIPASRSRGSSGVAVHNDLIYVVGGIQEGHLTGTVGWTDVFDPIAGTWTPLPNDMPNPRDHVSAAVGGGDLYMVGGRATEDGLFDSTIDVVDVLDLATGTWSTLADPIPTPRAAAGTAAFGTDIVVFGGESGTQFDAHVETEALDTLTGTWRTLQPMPAGLDRHGTSAVVLGCRIYAAAGSGARGGSPELRSTVAFQFSSCNPPTAPIGTLAASPATLNFGTVGVGSSSSINVVVQNPGTAPVTISSARVVGSDAGAFSVTTQVPVQVPAGGSRMIGVRFQPTATGLVGAPIEFGDAAAALAIVHSGANSAVTVPLTGTGGTVVAPPLISITHTSTTEGDAGSTFVDIVVSLSRPSPTPVTVDYASLGVPATPTIAIPGVDFAATSGTVTFAPGETTKHVPVEVYGDRIDEPPHLWGEWALLSFSNPSANAVLDTSFFGLGVVIIIDDDPPPVISILASSVVEGDVGSTFADLTVSLSNPSATTVTVDYASLAVPANPAVAIPGVDFAATSGTVTFAPGETVKTVTVEVFGDTIVEPPLLYGEWAIISFSNPSANAVLDTSFFGFGVVVIIDDDG